MKEEPEFVCQFPTGNGTICCRPVVDRKRLRCEEHTHSDIDLRGGGMMDEDHDEFTNDQLEYFTDELMGMRAQAHLYEKLSDELRKENERLRKALAEIAYPTRLTVSFVEHQRIALEALNPVEEEE